MKELCFIYSITNLINNKKYIGSSININKRKNTHFYELKDNIHKNEKLQRAYNKYGVENFIFDILEKFNINEFDRFEKEQFWMNELKSYKNGYNMTSNAAFNGGNIKYDKNRIDRMKEKLSITNKGKTPINFKEMQKKNWRPVLEYNNGILVAEYENVKKAGEATGISYKTIHKHLKDKELKKSKLLKSRKFPNIEWEYKSKNI